MASTPPPLPSSDEGEFDDDDDFGCFTGSAPIKAGVDSEPEGDDHHAQAQPEQSNATGDCVVNVPNNSAVKAMPLSKTSSESEVFCNGNQEPCEGKSGDTSNFSSRSSTNQPDIRNEETMHGNCSDQALNINSTTEEDSSNKSFSPKTDTHLDTNSQHVDTSLNSHISTCHNNYTAKEHNINQTCISEQGNSGEVISLKTTDLQSCQQETDDWADFSSASNDSKNSLQETTVKDNKSESFQPSDQIDESHDKLHVTEAAGNDSDSEGEVLESENIDVVIKDTEPSINESSNDSPKDEASMPHLGEAPASRSDFKDANDDNDSNNVIEKNPDPVFSSHENSHDQDGPVTNIDDGDDFGDFSDFSYHKEGSSKEDVAPISFRTSTCDDDIEEESQNDFENNNAFQSQTDHTGDSDSPLPYGNDDDEDEDWGFKSAGDQSETKDTNKEFGDFGSSNQGPSDDADWANFSDSATPKATASEEFTDFDDDEFVSPASTLKSTQIPSQEGLSKLEIAISSSFPDGNQVHSHWFSSQTENKDKHEPESNNQPKVQDDTKCLDSVIEMGLKTLPSAKQETWTITKDIRIKDPMVGIWERVKDVNASYALDYGWNSSQCSQDVYNTLHIDTKNVLFSQKKQAVPFFAPGLGILEPIRGGSHQAEKQNVQPPLVNTSKPDESPKEAPQDIPPVDFDWSSSGLTDPLKVFKSFEPFAEILQNSAAASQTSSDKELSPEAMKVLMKIPNLSFMQSKVLMFPIKDS